MSSVVHLDADAFFASVEQAADPRLRGRPMAVGGEHRGIIASASYEARQLGIHTPMPTARARQLCRDLIVIPGDFEKYERFSRFMFSYAYDHTPLVEEASIDEGFFDLGGQRRGNSPEIAATIQKAIRQRLKFTASFGLATNKIVSQVASKLRKPAGFTVIEPGRERDFLAPLPVSRLPGIGPKTAGLLQEAGLREIRHLAATPPDHLALFIGSRAPWIHQLARGEDSRPVVTGTVERQSLSHQHTFDEDVTDEAFVIATLRHQADRLLEKLRAENKTFRTLTLTFRYNDFQDVRRSFSFSEPTDLESEVYPALDRLLREAWHRRVSLRLTGVRFSSFYSHLFRGDLSLDVFSGNYHKARALAGAVDELRHRYGTRAIRRGHDLWLESCNGKPRSDLTRYPKQSRPSRSRRVSGKAERRPPISCAALLNIRSHYSFMDSLLSPTRAVEHAVAAGYDTIALTDPNLHGMVEFIDAARAAGVRPVVGAELTLHDPVRRIVRKQLAYVRTETGYHNLCFLLSQKTLSRDDLKEHRDGLELVTPGNREYALPEIRYENPGDHLFYQIVQSIRTRTLLHGRHPEKSTRPASFLSREALSGQFGHHAVSRTGALVAGENYLPDLGTLHLPDFTAPPGSNPRQYLKHLAESGLRRRYPEQWRRHLPQLHEELAIIAEVGYEEYFLTVRDLLQECRKREIEWLTRGSAADSLVCYCLEISSLCPFRFELYFRRFLNRDRMRLNKLPDIDVDFPHDRKDDVVDLVFQRFGARHAALVGGFNTFRARSAIADIAKVLGVSEYQCRRLTERLPAFSHPDELQDDPVFQIESGDALFSEEPNRTALKLAARLDGVPRYPKMHPCGVVVSRLPIHHLTPTFINAKNYPTTHADMNAAERLGLVKLDILAQGGLAVLRDARESVAARAPEIKTPATADDLKPWNDDTIWDMVSRGDTRGIHHIESPAMTHLHQMCCCRNIDVLIAIVSVIRPGAANTMRKERFALRSQGLEPVEYTHPSLEPVLKTTFGVVAYEEHVLQIAEVFAAWSAGRADQLRRALVKNRINTVREMKKEFIDHARRAGRTDAEIETVWDLLEGFRGYAFCRAHSTVYALEAYQAAWYKCYFPTEFFAAVLTHEKGFYDPLVYSIEARRHGIEFTSPSINGPLENFEPAVEEDVATGRERRMIRVPLNRIRNVSHGLIEVVRGERERNGPFRGLRDFFLRVRPDEPEMRNLIRCGAFDLTDPSRVAQFWNWRELASWPNDRDQGLLFAEESRSVPDERETTEPATRIVEAGVLERLRHEMELLGFTVSGHPLELFPEVDWGAYCPVAELERHAGRRVEVCGLIVTTRLHHQADGQPMKFLSLCDPSGIVETEMFAAAYKKWGEQTIRFPVLAVRATVQPNPNGNGITLNVHHAREPRKIADCRLLIVNWHCEPPQRHE